MSHTFYNSLDLTCKSPFGAVKAGQPVTFNLTVPEDLGYVDPHLVLTKDLEDPVHYRMEFTGQTPKVNHFALTVTPTTSGLYFYHFDLYTDFRRIYRTPGGEGVLSWTDGQDWQLTVYEPDFKTPDWLKTARCIRFSRTASARESLTKRCRLQTASTAPTRQASRISGPPSRARAT